MAQLRELIRMVQNSRFITASSANSRSTLGFVDVVNETKALIYGPFPLSSGAVVGIDDYPPNGIVTAELKIEERYGKKEKRK